MIASIRNPQSRLLCTLAANDESTLQYPLPDEIYGFHVQQSCEKLFKALINSHARRYPFTHELKALCGLLIECGESLPAVPYNLLHLEPFAVRLRYEVTRALTAQERAQMAQTVILIREFVLTRILELEGTDQAGPDRGATL